LPQPSVVLRPRAVAVAAATIAVGLALPSLASADWTPATELDSDVGVTGLTVDSTGARLVNGRRSVKKTVSTRLMGVAADGRPGALRMLTGLTEDPVPFNGNGVVYPRQSTIGTVRRTVPDGKGGTTSMSLTRYRLGVSVGKTAEATLGAQHTAATAVLDEPARIAGNLKGSVVLGWSDVGDDGVVRVFVASRAGKGGSTVRLGEPLQVSGSKSSRLLALATGSGGRTLVVYQTGATTSTRRLYVRSLSIGRGTLGKPQTLRRGGPGFTSATASVGAKGRAVVAWGEQDAAEERTVPYVVRATTRDTDDARFSVPKPLDRGTVAVRAPGGAVVSAIDATNRITLAWNQTVGSVADGTAHDIPRVAEAEATGALGVPRDLAAAGRVHAVAVAAAAATTGLVLVREQERPLGGSNGDRGVAVQAAFRPAGGTTGAPETIDQLTDRQLLDRSNAYGSASIGALPDGRYTVAWSRALIDGDVLRSAALTSDRTTAP
jgi:hypothetical protein